MVQQDDMAALLAADGKAVLAHVFQHVAVAHGGLFGVDALTLHIFDEAQIGHDRNHGGVAVQTAFFLHGHRQQGNDLVAVHLLTLFVAAKAAVSIAVKGNAAVKAAFHHGLFQIFQMGTAHALVDVLAVRLNADKGALCAQTGEQLLCHGSRSAVCAVDADPQAGQIAVDGLIQVIHIVLQAVIAAVHTAHLGTGLQLNARAIIVDVGFDLVLHLVRQLIAGTGKDLDAVELHRIVGGRDHDAGIGIVLAHQIGHSGRWQNAQTFHIRTHAAQTGGQGCFQHIAGLAGVLADQDARTVAGAAGQHRSSAAADLHCQLTGQVCACNTAHAIGSKVFSHNKTPLSIERRTLSVNALRHCQLPQKGELFGIFWFFAHEALPSGELDAKRPERVRTNSAARCPRAQRPPALSGPDVRRPAALRSGPGVSGSESPSASDTAHTGLPA